MTGSKDNSANQVPGAEQLWEQWAQWQNMWTSGHTPAGAAAASPGNPFGATAIPGQQLFDPEQLRRQIDQLNHVEQWLNWQLQMLAQSKQMLKMQADALDMLSPNKKK